MVAWPSAEAYIDYDTTEPQQASREAETTVQSFPGRTANAVAEVHMQSFLAVVQVH